MLNILLTINKADLKTSLGIMWKGVLAIFIVIALVIVVTKLVNKACVSLEQKAKEREEAKENQTPEE